MTIRSSGPTVIAPSIDAVGDSIERWGRDRTIGVLQLFDEPHEAVCVERLGGALDPRQPQPIELHVVEMEAVHRHHDGTECLGQACGDGRLPTPRRPGQAEHVATAASGIVGNLRDEFGKPEPRLAADLTHR